VNLLIIKILYYLLIIKSISLIFPNRPQVGAASYKITRFKGIVHFEINFWYVLAYLKGIQDVGVFVSTVFFHFNIFWSNRCCLSVI